MAKSMTIEEKIAALLELATKNTEENEMKQAMLKVEALCKKYGFKIVKGKVVKDTSAQQTAHTTATEMDWQDVSDIDTYMCKLFAEMLTALNIEYELIMSGKTAKGIKAKCSAETAQTIQSVTKNLFRQEASLYRKLAKEGKSRGFREMFIPLFKDGISGKTDSDVAELAYNAMQDIKATLA